MSRTDENELRALFAEIDPPPGLDRWRERIADVHAEPCESVRHEPDPGPAPVEGAIIIPLPTGHELRPKRQRKRSVAVAASAAVVVGLAGLVVTTQLLNEAPPADPTMIIDGPDRTVSTLPPPTSREVSTSGSNTSSPPPTVQTNPNPGTTGSDESPGGTRVENGGPVSGNEPSWPPMSGDPTAANTGVPLGATLGDHYGDLRITTAGQVVTDLRVNGSVIVDAPNVTLRRVLVVAPYGTPAIRQNAGGLTVENSELSGGSSLTQGASGLVVRRSRLENGGIITSGAQVLDSYFGDADVLIPSGANGVLLRHNAMGQVTMSDLDAPIRGVTIENSVLTQVDAPTQAGSASIHVVGNRFRGSAPSTGWNASAPDYQWSNNTYADSGAPAKP
jgi:hypothetical protein